MLMNTESAVSSELVRLSRAVRFGLASVVIGLSYPNIHCALNLRRFQELFEGMGVKPSVAFTFLQANQPWFISLSILFPLAAIASLFTPGHVRSLYLSGFLIIAVFAQLFYTWFACTAPWFLMINSMAK